MSILCAKLSPAIGVRIACNKLDFIDNILDVWLDLILWHSTR